MFPTARYLKTKNKTNPVEPRTPRLAFPNIIEKVKSEARNIRIKKI